MGLPSQKNITIYKGDTYEFLFYLKDSPTTYVDLTGATPKAQIRDTATSAQVAVEFTAALTNQVSDPGGVRLSLTAAQTAALTSATGVWDVQLTWPDTSVRTYLQGTVTVVQEVTRV